MNILNILIDDIDILLKDFDMLCLQECINERVSDLLVTGTNKLPDNYYHNIEICKETDYKHCSTRDAINKIMSRIIAVSDTFRINNVTIIEQFSDGKYVYLKVGLK